MNSLSDDEIPIKNKICSMLYFKKPTLFGVVKAGIFGQLQELLEYGVDSNCSSSDSVLYAAISIRNCLLQRKDHRSEYQQSLYDEDKYNQIEEKINLLQKFGARILKREIFYLCSNGYDYDYKFLECALYEYEDVSAIKEDKRTLLFDAASRGTVKKVQLLLSVGVNPDMQYGTGDTALHIAARRPEKIGKLQAMLEAGAFIDPKDCNGFTPLLHASRTLHDDGGPNPAIQLLLDYGADIEVRGWDDLRYKENYMIEIFLKGSRVLKPRIY